jgi:hypothetical protein
VRVIAQSEESEGGSARPNRARPSGRARYSVADRSGASAHDVELPLLAQSLLEAQRTLVGTGSVANDPKRLSLAGFAYRDVMECQARSLRLDARDLDHLCPFFRFGRDISAELGGGEYHGYGAKLGEP